MFGRLVSGMSSRLREWRSAVAERVLLRTLNTAIEDEMSILPYRVSIELKSYCNGVCTFCPANKLVDTRGKNTMPAEVLHRILDDLAAVAYCGVVSFHGNSEPLLNDDIVDVVRLAKSRMPHCLISIWTNGTKLDWATHGALFDAGVSHMHINNYSYKGTLHKSVASFLAAFRASPYASRRDIVVDLEMRKVDEVLYNKGGIAPNKLAGPDFKTLAAGCGTPMTEMQINYNGDAYSCCFDDYYAVTLGNVMTDGVLGVWNSPAYRQYRREVVNGKRGNYEPCANCDIPHNLPAGHQVRHTTSGHPIFIIPGFMGRP